MLKTPLITVFLGHPVCIRNCRCTKFFYLSLFLWWKRIGKFPTRDTEDGKKSRKKWKKGSSTNNNGNKMKI